MQDIAQEAGVSKATVSRVINEDSYVSKSTKKKVMGVVNKYNYKPHTVARGLARDLSHTIGLMIPGPPRNITDPFFLEFLHGAGNKAAEYSYSLSLPTISDNNEQKLYEEVIDKNDIDGLIITDPQVNDFRVDYLKKEGIPFLFLGRTFADENVCWVDGDNVGGAYQATDYLIKQGHEKIACISGPTKFVASHTRFEGYRQALSENGFVFNSNLVIRGDFTKEGGYLAIKKLLAKADFFSAVFAINDAMAMGAIQALKEEGVNIPQECAVIGFDGIDLGDYITPKLTTVRQPVYQLGQESVKKLIKLIKGQEINEKQKILPVELLSKDSV